MSTYLDDHRPMELWMKIGRDVMKVADDNASVISEGAYLKLCNAAKQHYNAVPQAKYDESLHVAAMLLEGRFVDQIRYSQLQDEHIALQREVLNVQVELHEATKDESDCNQMIGLLLKLQNKKATMRDKRMLRRLLRAYTKK
jgi:hypothetical protein